MREYSIAAIPADGIGPEVIDAGISVLKALAEQRGDLRLNFNVFDWGSDYYKRNGAMMRPTGWNSSRSSTRSTSEPSARSTFPTM